MVSCSEIDGTAVYNSASEQFLGTALAPKLEYDAFSFANIIDDHYPCLIRMFTHYIIITSVVFGLPCNLYCFLFYIRRRKELGNAFLAYMNIADAIHCLSNMVLFVALYGKITETEFRVLALTVASTVTRSSITVTGVITIYLNILRTSAIIWPMLQFNRKRLHVSLSIILVCFVIFEIALVVFYNYPVIKHSFSITDRSTNAIPLFSVDHPLRVIFNYSTISLAIPIILLVVVCCIVSTSKLIRPNKNLNHNHDSNTKRGAAITVLILSIHYVVLNTFAVVLLSLEYHLERVREKDQSVVEIPRSLLLNIAIAFLQLNSILNPLIYICRVNKLREPLKNMINKFLTGGVSRNLQVEPSPGPGLGISSE